MGFAKQGERNLGVSLPSVNCNGTVEIDDKKRERCDGVERGRVVNAKEFLIHVHSQK